MRRSGEATAAKGLFAAEQGGCGRLGFGAAPAWRTGSREGPGWRLKGGARDFGRAAADLEASEDRGEEVSARGKRIEPLLRVIPGSGEEASRREGLR